MYVKFENHWPRQFKVVENHFPNCGGKVTRLRKENEWNLHYMLQHPFIFIWEWHSSYRVCCVSSKAEGQKRYWYFHCRYITGDAVLVGAEYPLFKAAVHTGI